MGNRTRARGWRAAGIGAVGLMVAGCNLGVAPVTYQLLDASQVNLPLEPSGMAVGDIDHDGDPDVVVSGRSGYAVLTNDGHGMLALSFPTRFETDTRDPSLVDVDGDGDLDLVGIVGGNGSSLPAVLSVRRNDGTGAFGAIEADLSQPGPGELNTLVPADVDGDGDADLLGGIRIGLDRHVGVYLNDGTGAFGPPAIYPLGFTSDTATPLHLAVGDLNGDGHTDVVATDALRVERPDGLTFPRTFVMTALNDGTGAFAAAAAPIDAAYTDVFAQSPALVDLDGDGHLDVAVGRTTGSGIATLLGDGQGGLGAVRESSLAGVRGVDHLAPADIDGDGHADLVGFTENTDAKSGVVAYGDGTGGVADNHLMFTGTQLGGAGTPALKVAVADLDGDGDDDVLFLAGSLGVLQNAMNGRRQHDEPTTTGG